MVRLSSRSLDRLVETLSRSLAQRSSRRSLLARLGGIVAGGSVLPLLPLARRVQAQLAAPDAGDPTQCDYWRYCAFDGYLCTCCGGTITACPPGTSLSPTAWVGTCQNPVNGKMYTIAYRDCCGRNICRRCECLRTEGEQPAYRPQFNNDISWCFGAENMTYHCTIAPIVGEA